MPHNGDRILAYLANHPEGQDDGQIAAALGIDHVQVNSICRRLANAGAIWRGRPASGAKLLNCTTPLQMAADSLTAPDSHSQTSATPIPHVSLAGPLIWLADSHAVKQFGYAGEAHLTEDQVKAAIKRALEAQGWSTAVAWGHIHGIDIEAISGDERFVLEAKGEGASNPARSVNFDGALGELIRRMSAPGARYGLALPAHRQFVSLVARLPLWIRQRLDLWFFFVRPHAQEMEVGVFPPDGKRDSL